MIRSFVSRVRRAFAPDRASWSYRYHLAGDTPGTGPISAIYVVVAMDLRARNHALVEGAPDPVIDSRRQAEEVLADG